MLVERLVSSLPPDCVHFHCPVVSVEKGTKGKPYDVIVASGTIVPSDLVIITSPAFAAADMLEKLETEASTMLRKIQYSSCAVMNLIYNRADIPHPLDGFGFVIPAVEKRTILACSFASVKFPGRCPPEKAVLRIFAGGAMQQDVFDLTDEQIECLMWEDLHTYLNLKSVPLLSLITRHNRSMPQYHVGHLGLVGEIKGKLAPHPGILLAGSAYDGVGIPDCIRSGETAASKALELLPAQKALAEAMLAQQAAAEPMPESSGTTT
jgi:oxygen-dependent protoporphyrinogen oxidase